MAERSTGSAHGAMRMIYLTSVKKRQKRSNPDDLGPKRTEGLFWISNQPSDLRRDGRI